VAAVLLAEWRFLAYARAQDATEVAAYVGRSTVALRGVVADDPVAFGGGWEFPVAARRMELGGDWVVASGTVMVRGMATAPYRVGDLLDVAGVLLPANPAGPPFLSPLRQEGIEAVANRPAITPLGAREPSVVTWLANRREDAAAVLNRSVPEPEAGLARGITLGERRTLAADLDGDFQRTNTSHILAVDGLKMGYVGALVAVLLGRTLPPIPTALGTILGLAGYTAFVGASPSAIRAAVMGALFAWGRAIGRPSDSLNGLALATLGMTLVNPFLLGAAGFQLSVVTTAGLVLLVPIVEGWVPEAVLPRGRGSPRGMLR
jgi:ComEC/Rec2-related protein